MCKTQEYHNLHLLSSPRAGASSAAEVPWVPAARAAPAVGRGWPNRGAGGSAVVAEGAGEGGQRGNLLI